MPKDIPADPKSFYKNEWENWGIFLGTGTIATKYSFFWPYEKAKKFLKKINLKNENQFYNLKKK